MLRYRPSEVQLTPDDIERASLRINSQKKMATVRPPPSLRLPMVVSPQEATIHYGPERSIDDASIHFGHALALRPHLHAEYVSSQHSSVGLNQHTTKDCAARRGSDSFSDSAGSVNISTSPSPALHNNTRRFKCGHRVCSNPLSMLRLAAQQPATKNTSIPLSSSSKPHPPSRYTITDNSDQGVEPILGYLGTYPTLDQPEGPWYAWETLAHEFVRRLNREDLTTLPSILRAHISHFPNIESADYRLVKSINEYYGLDYPPTTLTPIPYSKFTDIMENAVAYRIMVLDRSTPSSEINTNPVEDIFIENSTSSITHRGGAQRRSHSSAAHAIEDHTTSPLELLQSNLRGLQDSLASTYPESPVSEHFEPFHQQMQPISRLPRSVATPATTLYDQENSESAAMSVLSADVRRLRVRDTSLTDDGIMNDTPPRETRLTRHLRVRPPLSTGQLSLL